jgi:hypothetical protein
VKERLIENWLTSASERSLEMPFVQVLMLRGHTVISGPAHHPYEHGKDLLSVDSEGHLCAFQLKGGTGRFGLREFEKHEVQLHALATTTASHPNLSTPRVPDRVYLVTNQELSPAARSRVGRLSEGLREHSYPGVEVVERHELLGWFVSAHGSFFPQEAHDVACLLQVFLESGVGPLPHRRYVGVISNVMPSQSRARRTECARAITAATLLASYMLRPWQEKKNHAVVAEGWILLCSQILRLAAAQNLRSTHWEPSYSLAMEAARDALECLLCEASASQDFLGAGLGEPLLYGTKVLMIGGYLSAFALSSRLITTGRPEDSDKLISTVAAIIRRELPYLKVLGESAAPHYFAVSYLLSKAGDFKVSTQMIMNWARLLSRANAPGSSTALPDPYHGPEQLLMALVSADARENVSREQWDGSSYSLHLAVSWMTRRHLRQSLGFLWPDITKISHHDFLPSDAPGFLSPEDPSGVLDTWLYPTPTSWRTLHQQADAFEPGFLSGLLVDRPDFMLLYPLVQPHRFNSRVLRFWDAVLAEYPDPAGTDSRRAG